VSIDIINSLSIEVKKRIVKGSLACYEKNEEACGLLLNNGQVEWCQNCAVEPEVDFAIDSRLYAVWEPIVIAIYHSHINGNRNFTPADVLLAKRTGKPLILYDVVHSQFSFIDPTGKTPLLGRDFVYGIYDCFSLIRDWYGQELGIELKDYDRDSIYSGEGDSLIWDSWDWDIIDRNTRDWGFHQVKTPRRGDVIGMSLGGTNTHVNHLALYLGEDRFIHQLLNRKSCEEVWGEPWVSYTTKFWRHESQWISGC
jgi:proteasome lid subunit RPN8/RPN11